LFVSVGWGGGGVTSTKADRIFFPRLAIVVDFNG